MSRMPRANCWIMLASPPVLLTTREPNRCMPNVRPPRSRGLTTQYQKQTASAITVAIS